MQSIGVGITTRNRVDVLESTVKKFNEYYDDSVQYLVVDDNSDDPDSNRRWADLIGDYHYNEERLGVAKSKNKCIELLDVDHLFLFDDDCIPIRPEWWKPWVESGINHMVYACQPNIQISRTTSSLIFWEGGFGCCLYLTRKCIETVGGFDPRFDMWGFEHAELTCRIGRTDLVTHQNICPKIPGVWSFDAQGSYQDIIWESNSSISEQEKQKQIAINGPIMQKVMSERNTFVDIYGSSDSK